MYEREAQELQSNINSKVWEKLKKYNCMIAGGAITSIFTHNKVNDIDIYFRSNKDYFYFCKELLDKNAFHILYATDNAITFTDKFVSRLSTEKQKPILQAICIDYYASPDDIFKSYDFTINMGAYDFSTDSFVLNDDFIYHNMKRELHFNTSCNFPLDTIFRIDKYTNRGYYISKAEKLKLMIAINSLELNSWNDLTENIRGYYKNNISLNIPSGMEFNLENAFEVLDNCYINTNSQMHNFMNVESVFNTICEKSKYKIQCRILNKNNNRVLFIDENNRLYNRPLSSLENNLYNFNEVSYSEVQPIYLYLLCKVNNGKYTVDINGRTIELNVGYSYQANDENYALSCVTDYNSCNNSYGAILKVRVINPKDIVLKSMLSSGLIFRRNHHQLLLEPSTNFALTRFIVESVEVDDTRCESPSDDLFFDTEEDWDL